MTAWIGKNHNTPTWETSAAGPFDRWANGLGFDYFYGFNGGDMNHWNPILYENRNLVPASTDPNYHLTTDLADKAIAWVRQGQEHRARPAVLPLRRARRDARPAPRAEGVDRQVQGQVRQGLGQVPRGDARAAEEARRRPAGHEADRALRRAAGVGFAERRPEAALRPHDGGVRRLRGAVRLRDGPRRRRRASNCRTPTTRSFIYIAGDNGSSAEGGLEGIAQREPVLQRLPGEVAGQHQGHRRTRRAEALQPLPGRLGARDGHALPVDQAGRQPLRRHAQPDDHLVAGEDQGQGRTARPVPARDRHRPDDLRS